MDEFGFDALFSEGVNEQEAAEPAEEKESGQTAEENAAFANVRRKAEEEARLKIESAVTRQKEELESMIGGLGLMNPYTGKNLATMKDLAEYADSVREENKKLSLEKMEQAGYSRDEIEQVINDLVANHPDVRQAANSRKELERLKHEASLQKMQQHTEAEIKKIQAYNPKIKTVSDIVKSEKGEDIVAMVKRGYSFSDAYYLANREQIGQRAAERSRQEAINATRSKNHLQKSVTHGDGGVDVPADVIAQYQQLNPGMSADDIRKWVARDQKRMKQQNQERQ